MVCLRVHAFVYTPAILNAAWVGAVPAAASSEPPDTRLRGHGSDCQPRLVPVSQSPSLNR